MRAQQPMTINQNETQTGIASPIITDNLNNDTFFAELGTVNNVKIIQKAECIEFLYPKCIPNRYEVVYPNGQLMYDFKEKSDFCERYWCHPIRGFEMNITNVTSANNRTSVIMQGNKNCSIPFMYCCGCGKPTFSIDVKSPIGFRIGKAKLGYDNICCYLCENRIDIFDNSNNIRYIIKPSCLCLGVYCHHYVKCCDFEYKIMQDGQTVGTIIKDTCNDAVTFFTKADNYLINFPLNATPQDKMLLICGAILIDYLSFYL